MKTKLLALAALLASASAFAAPLTETTAIHTKPDPSSPAVTFLKAGTEPAVVRDSGGSTPAGWLAVELPGPFEAYVLNKDLTKSLDVKVGANLYLAPKPDAGVLTVAAPDDKTTLTGLYGKWTQIRLERKLTGYIYLGGTPGYHSAIAPTPAPAAPPAAPGARMAAARRLASVAASCSARRPGERHEMEDEYEALGAAHWTEEFAGRSPRSDGRTAGA